MNDVLWAEVEQAYTETVELPPEEQTVFLRKAYADRPDIRAEVESLLNYKSAAAALNQTTVVLAAAEMFADEDAEFIGTIVADKYVVRSRLGSGGMADVYLADHIALNIPVALKRPKPELRLDPGFRKTFLEEARRAVVLNDENVARVHDVIDADDDMFVVMEYIEGETLRRRLSSLTQPFTIDEFLPIAIQCASALAAAHEKRIVHLDVKPENIMLTPSGHVKICDFGVARRLSPKLSDSSTLTYSTRGVLAGTPAYMAPEVVLGNPFNERADLFSLGIVFYEMLTGSNPFLAETSLATTAKIVSHPPPPVSSIRKDLDPRLERAIARMLAKEPDQRYATARDLVQELRAIARSRSRLQDLAHDAGEALRESLLLRIASVLVLLCVMAAPFAWIYRDPLGAWITRTQLPEKKIVVVLPFQVIGENGDEHLYSQGVSEILTSRLTQLTGIPDLQIIPPNAIREAKVDSVEKARAEFGATLVLAGMFQFSSDQARISYSLIRAPDRKVLRAATPKTVSAADPFAIQDIVVQDLVNMLKLELTPTAAAMLQEYGTSNVKAFFLYTEGLGALANYQDLENVEKAINLFTQATEQDDRYADAYASLGRAYWQKFSRRKEERAWLDLGQMACAKAASLEQHLSEAEVCLGLVNEYKGDYELAIEYYRRAIEYSPANDDAHRALGSVLEQLHRFDEAEKTYLHAIELRPQYWAGHSWIAGYYNARHDYAKAIDHYYKALALSPDNAQVYYSLGLVYTNKGEYPNGIEFLKKSALLRPELAPAYANLGLTYLRARQYTEALGPLQKAVSLTEEKDYRFTGNLARIYSLLGQPEKAVKFYELGIQQGQKILQLNPRDPAVHLLVGRYYAMLGKKPEAISHTTLALEGIRYDDPHYLAIAATAYVRLGDRDTALTYLEQAARLGYTTNQIKAEPELDALEGDPRYLALMASISQGR